MFLVAGPVAGILSTILFNKSGLDLKSHISPKKWSVNIGFFLISDFLRIQYRISNIWLLRQDNYFKKINASFILFIVRIIFRHYKGDYVNCHYCCKYIEFLQYLLLQWSLEYKKYYASRKLIFAWLICVYAIPWTFCRTHPNHFWSYYASYKTNNFGAW